MAQMDWGGLAAVIGAVGGFLGVCLNLYISYINFRDARQAKREQAEHRQILCNIASQVGANENASVPDKVP